MRVAVTGASGFVGGALCRAAAAAGWTVYGYGRRPAQLPGVRYRIWDLDTGPLPDPSTVDAVVHAAAAVTDWGAAAPVWRTNLGGTRHVLASFPRARIVYVSTASVYDPYTPTVNAREDAAPVTRYLTAYAASKAAAELLLAGRPNTVVVRPHAVYGPGDPTLLPRVLAAVRGDTLWIVGDGSARHSLTSIDNLVSALLLACDSNAPAGVYNIADPAPVVLGDALGGLMAARGLPVTVRGLPVRPVRSAARIAEAAWRMTRRPRPPRLTRYAISQLAVERTLDLSQARARLGFRPAPTSFAGAAGW
jgi:nucleoside-diphosphate-sugar epimerase